MAKKKIKFNVTLLKVGLDISNCKSFVQDYSDENLIKIEPPLPKNVFLYKRISKRDQLEWIKLLETKILGSLVSDGFPKNRSSGATLFMEVSNRIFALNFGALGRFNIQTSAIERNFGLYTANKFFRENNALLKSSQSCVNETNPVNKKKHYGQEIPEDIYSLSMEDNEAISELILTIKESNDLHRMIGKLNSLTVQFLFDNTNGEVPCIDYLPKKLQSLLETYNSVTKEDKKSLFKGIYPLEQDSLRYKRLNCILAKKLIKNNDSFFLFEPEIDIDLSQASFKINVPGHEEHKDSLNLGDYLGLRSSPTLDNLEKDKVTVLNEDDKPIKDWSVFYCLYGEITLHKVNYVLSKGEWYEVDRDKYQRITKKVESISDRYFTISASVKEQSRNEILRSISSEPKARIYKENIFNKILCSDLKGEFFDEQKKQITIYDDKFEVCDILWCQKSVTEFIHVKYNSGADSISHLTNQGFVSAKSYVDFKEDYIKKVNALIGNATHELPKEHRGSIVRYLIINDKKDDKLTFFSKMQMEEKIRALEGMGFVVKLSWVRDIYPPRPAKKKPTKRHDKKHIN